MLTKNLPPVLLVEDSPDDIEFARRALAKCDAPHRLVIAEDGDAAIELLTGAGEIGAADPFDLDARSPGSR